MHGRQRPPKSLRVPFIREVANGVCQSGSAAARKPGTPAAGRRPCNEQDDERHEGMVGRVGQLRAGLSPSLPLLLRRGTGGEVRRAGPRGLGNQLSPPPGSRSPQAAATGRGPGHVPHHARHHGGVSRALPDGPGKPLAGRQRRPDRQQAAPGLCQGPLHPPGILPAGDPVSLHDRGGRRRRPRLLGARRPALPGAAQCADQARLRRGLCDLGLLRAAAGRGRRGGSVSPARILRDRHGLDREGKPASAYAAHPGTDPLRIAAVEAGQSDAAVRRVFNALRAEPKIRWKESYKAVLGLAPASRRAWTSRAEGGRPAPSLPAPQEPQGRARRARAAPTQNSTSPIRSMISTPPA